MFLSLIHFPPLQPILRSSREIILTLSLIKDSQSIDWGNVLNTTSNPSVMFDTFYSKISEIIYMHIPVKQLCKRELKIQSKPWITPAIKVSIQVHKKIIQKNS